MTVVLPDRDLTARARRHPWVRDERGMPVPAAEPNWTTRGPYPGAAEEQADGTWALRIDPRAWPLLAGDQVTDGDKTWILVGEPKLHAIPGVPDVDHVAATGTLDPPQVP